MSAIYLGAASVLADMDISKRGFRDAFYTRFGNKNCSPAVKKQVFALVCKVLQDAPCIDAIIAKSGLSNAPCALVVAGDPATDVTRSATGTTRRREPRVLRDTDKHSAKLCVHRNVQLRRVMAWDLLFGKGLRSGGPIATELRRNKDALLQLKDTVSARCENTSTVVPRYLRVNSHRISLTEAENQLTEHLQRRSSSDAREQKAYFIIDSSIPNLLRMTDADHVGAVMEHPLLQSGMVVFQDKASCMSAVAAELRPGLCVLDACAAPGSKTLHCIDMLQGRGRVIAVERDARRAKMLIERIKLCADVAGPFACLGCKAPASGSGVSDPVKKKDKRNGDSNSREGRCTEEPKARSLFSKSLFFANSTHDLIVQVVLSDFLQISASDLQLTALCKKCSEKLSNDTDRTKYQMPPVNVVFVDPSCSGTGLPMHRFGAPAQPQCSRIEKLAVFQNVILSHALSEFRFADAICYSTCSIDFRENEAVVYNVLRNLPSGCHFHLADIKDKCWGTEVTSASDYLRHADHNKEKLLEIAQRCFHSDPVVDHCRGFFLAKLVHDFKV